MGKLSKNYKIGLIGGQNINLHNKCIPIYLKMKQIK